MRAICENMKMSSTCAFCITPTLGNDFEGVLGV